MIKVKTRADLDQLAGRAPKAAAAVPAPRPAPAPVAAPQVAAPQPAKSAIDPELRALLGAMAQNLTVATNLIAQQAKAAAAPPAVIAPPAPVPVAEKVPELAPEPARQRVLPSVMALRQTGVVPEQTLPYVAPEPEITGPLEAVITRDKQDRMAGVTISGAQLVATIARDSKDRMSTIAIERGGKQTLGTIHRDRKGRIEKITMTGTGNANH